MIKLNNKNITYVALADSNNSLKAPKEIWYADSNNSVKLVYRRKDALIEGEDYEKYHWLIANTPYGTNIELPLNTANFSFKRIWRDTFNDILFISNSEQYVYHAVSKNAQIWDIPNAIGTFFGNANRILNEEVIIYSTDGNLMIGYEEVPQIDYPPSIIRFRNADRVNSTQYSTSAITVNNIERYIPCKLLKPVPKWLDANGIRRQAGECGMIDLVSGKFYGNVNSVGTFTVENYYERKEWLVVQTTEKVTMMALPLRTSDFKYSLQLLDNVPNLSYFTSSWHTYGVTNTQTLVFVYDRKNSTRVYSCQTGFQLGDIITIDSTEEDLLFNNISIPKYGFPAENFIIQTNNNVALNMKISSITVDGVERYIPCTLTIDLPASMDANNIARTKGTSGMWDLVSDRFYGNVASSGTFKAVNLAEGVDYEVHQWLVAEVDTKATMCILPVDSNVIEFKSKRIRGRNFHYFHTDGDYVYFCASGLQKAIYNYNTSATIYCSSIVASGEEVIISCNDSKILMGNDELPIYGYPITSVRISVADSEGMETLTSSVTVDGVERYIPVKLLKSIPSKYDANGIARQAGECGMYDTVNDKFYGNVASSGSFTVSDDN